jgi:hypothetical protein
MFQIKVEEKSKHILRLVTFFRKSCRFGDEPEKSGGAREAANDNMAAPCMLSNQCHTHTRARASTQAHTE